MKNATMIPLVVAGGCGLVAMLGVKQYLANKDGENEVPMATALVCLLYTSPSPRDQRGSRMPSSA